MLTFDDVVAFSANEEDTLDTGACATVESFRILARRHHRPGDAPLGDPIRLSDESDGEGASHPVT